MLKLKRGLLLLYPLAIGATQWLEWVIAAKRDIALSDAFYERIVLREHNSLTRSFHEVVLNQEGILASAAFNPLGVVTLRVAICKP